MWKKIVCCFFNKILPSSFGIDGEKITHKHRTNANTFIVMISKDDELQVIILCKIIRGNEWKVYTFNLMWNIRKKKTTRNQTNEKTLKFS